MSICSSQRISSSYRVQLLNLGSPQLSSPGKENVVRTPIHSRRQTTADQQLEVIFLQNAIKYVKDFKKYKEELVRDSEPSTMRLCLKAS
ncbi:hypothetical protein EB796_002829 [Bugula neritina]|uniref:Uncharacterized protein n=1 Tax=Bugula neritina TaxID=10212 RepID=A0A7J7KKM8_BUGNE|nr:hypothetical protein EB796_002829 [Bugula neritina]